MQLNYDAQGLVPVVIQDWRTGEVLTLAYANEHRDWRVFAEIAGVLMRRAQRLYGETPPELGLEADLFALDATVIELSLALFPWARWQKAQASVKLNVLLDVRNDLPVFASLHEGNRHEVASLDEDRDPLTVEVPEEFFNGTEHKLDWRERRQYEEFTFGWAITCHKSQGSEWPNVIVFDESGAFREDRWKWLYTAVTRAGEKVTVVQ